MESRQNIPVRAVRNVLVRSLKWSVPFPEREPKIQDLRINFRKSQRNFKLVLVNFNLDNFKINRDAGEFPGIDGGQQKLSEQDIVIIPGYWGLAARRDYNFLKQLVLRVARARDSPETQQNFVIQGMVEIPRARDSAELDQNFLKQPIIRVPRSRNPAANGQDLTKQIVI